MKGCWEKIQQSKRGWAIILLIGLTAPQPVCAQNFPAPAPQILHASAPVAAPPTPSYYYFGQSQSTSNRSDKRRAAVIFAIVYIIVSSALLIFLLWFTFKTRNRDKNAIMDYALRLAEERETTRQRREEIAFSRVDEEHEEIIEHGHASQPEDPDVVKLSALKDLLNHGVISTVEYNQRKGEILSKI